MHPRLILRLLATICLACALLTPAFSYARTSINAPTQSITGNLSDFYYVGNTGTLEVEKSGKTYTFNFGGNLTINGRNWSSWGMTPQDQGPALPSVLKLHCTLVKVYYAGAGAQPTATALKTLGNGSRYFC